MGILVSGHHNIGDRKMSLIAYQGVYIKGFYSITTINEYQGVYIEGFNCIN